MNPATIRTTKMDVHSSDVVEVNACSWTVTSNIIPEEYLELCSGSLYHTRFHLSSNSHHSKHTGKLWNLRSSNLLNVLSELYFSIRLTHIFLSCLILGYIVHWTCLDYMDSQVACIWSRKYPLTLASNIGHVEWYSPVWLKNIYDSMPWRMRVLNARNSGFTKYWF